MKVGICPSPKKPESAKYVDSIATFLKKYGAQVYIDSDSEDGHRLPKIDHKTHLDLIITLGGDGTLLYYRKKYHQMKHTSFTAVNLGGLGFMADVPVDQIEDYLKELLEGKYTLEQRLMLEGKKPNGQTLEAVNDFVFHRGSIASMIQLKVTINNDHFNTFQADGLIVSTPTGSSAYSLACGGPLMHPMLKAFVLTTISGHTLTNRPFVIPDDSLINIEFISDKNDTIDVTVDGIDTYPMRPGEITRLYASKQTFPLVHYELNNFYETVRLKLHWKGKSTL